MSGDVEMLRHALAALTYRLGKVVINAPDDFGAFEPGHGARTPAEILAHVGDVLAWGTGRITGAPRQPHAPSDWEQEVLRFGAITWTLNRALLDWNNPDADTARRLLQGPIADAMTHVGQLAMLCRMAGRPIAGENFYDAPIAALERDGTE